jgi:MFS family permease
MVTVLIAGMGMMQGMAASNTIIQTLVTEDKRGRVMSYYTMAFVGMAPFGSLLAGTMAHAIPPTPAWIVGGPLLAGAQWTVIVNGVIVVLGAAWFFTRLPEMRRTVRPIYQELGIIPSAKEMAAEQVRS